MTVATSIAAEPVAHEVRTLVCKRDMANALLCYESLLAATHPKLNLFIHEDGTLDEEDLNTLRKRFPSATVLRRADTEQEVLEALARHPHCRAFRAAHPLSNKLLDIPLLSREHLRFIDSDILFFRKVDSLFPVGTSPVSMVDDDQGYSARLIDLVIRFGIRLPSGFNSGLMSLALAGYDLDRIEWFLGHPELTRLPSMVEQTCFAMLAAPNDLRHFSPEQFFCKKHRPLQVTSETVAVHFIYHMKGLISSYYPAAMESLAQSPSANLQFVPATPLTLMKIIKRRFMRRFTPLSSSV
jgi:hypothetical protein